MATLATNFNLNKHYNQEIKSLLAFVCKCDLSWLLSHPEYELNSEEYLSFNQAYELLLAGTPLAYIIGEQSFYNHNFKVSPSVLIPRPETELIIDKALEYLKQSQLKTACLDIGTGSGAIIVSIAAQLQKTAPELFKACKFIAGDISTTALTQAQANAQRHGLGNKITFILGDLFEPFTELITKDELQTLFIAANLPYLTNKERKQENSIQLEPDLALLGGKDGLELYFKLLQQLSEHQDKFNFHLIMEINPGQAERLIQASDKYLRKVEIKKTPDLNGQTRFIEVTKNKLT